MPCQAQLSLGISQDGNDEVSGSLQPQERASGASSITGAQGRRCMRLVHFQGPLERGAESWGGGGMCHSNGYLHALSPGN